MNLGLQSLSTVTSLLDGSSRRIGTYAVNLKLICEALWVFLITFYGPKFFENGKILDLKCSKDVSEANFKDAGQARWRFIECCGKSKSLFFNISP
jgi:hypothetical protein